ncbi:MAG: hypothetical protein GYB64_04860, partial [Chloroflexi bacterium]|nr:hypothetical protein [Chloroflexota bacterium]
MIKTAVAQAGDRGAAACPDRARAAAHRAEVAPAAATCLAHGPVRAHQVVAPAAATCPDRARAAVHLAEVAPAAATCLGHGPV